MSRHRLYRNYNFHNDLDEYDGEADGDDGGGDSLSDGDQILMREGTEAVLAAMGPSAGKLTVEQIQEALWYYYFDVDKSLVYLMDKFINPKSKPKSADRDDRQGAVTRVSFASFFSDMPWLNIPKDREAVFIAPRGYRGGLLGGSGPPPKISKLQALAAARKKKVEDRKSGEEKSQDASESLGRLSLKEALDGEQPESVAKRRRLGREPEPGPAATPDDCQDPPPTQVDSEDLTSSMGLDGQADMGPPEPQTEVLEAPLAHPSAFAQTLLGSSLDSQGRAQLESFSYPYLALSPSCVQDAFSGPSPDDRVLAAQAKASKSKSPTTTSPTTGPKKNHAGGPKTNTTPAETKVDQLPRGKNLNVLDEYEKSKSKPSASFVVVGHVDAGKSTLMGRLLLDLKQVDERTIERYRKEAESMGKSSFALAWVLDQGTEERARGVTIDIATNRFETEHTLFTILDAPGHRDFIPNMIAGASQADFAILVIDAGTGAFESGLKGQTREHSLLIRSMGVSRIIVAINKLDSVGWSKERFDEICHQVSGFLSTTGFLPKNISFVPVSGLLGDNLVNKSTDTAAAWYTGATLLEELEKSEPLTRSLTKPLRLTISEVYKTSLGAITVAGRIDAGSLQVGDAVLVQPSGETAYVKSLELDMELLDWAVAGQNIAVHLTKIDPIHIKVGDVVCDVKNPIESIDTLTLKVLAFDFLMPMKVDVHRNRFHASGQIQEMVATLNKTTGAMVKKKPKVVQPGSVARIVVKLGSKVPLEKGQRIVLRSGGNTVAAGLLE